MPFVQNILLLTPNYYKQAMDALRFWTKRNCKMSFNLNVSYVGSIITYTLRCKKNLMQQEKALFAPLPKRKLHHNPF